MSHILDMMSTICRQLIALNNYYGNGDSKGLIRTIPSRPEFIDVAISRSILQDESVLIDMTTSISVEKTIKINLDNSSCLYLCVATNIKNPIIDKVPIYVSSKDDSCFGIGYIVVIPKILFTSTESVESIKILKNIYFTLLKFDNNTEFELSPVAIRLAKSKKIKISSYDLTLCVVAVCFIYHTARKWFTYTNADNSISEIGPDEIFKAFSEKELDDEARKSLTRVMENYCYNYDDIKNGVANGKLIRMFTFPKKK